MFVIEYVPIYSIGILEMNILRVQTSVYIKLKTALGDNAVAGSFIHPYARRDLINIVYKCTTLINT